MTNNQCRPISPVSVDEPPRPQLSGYESGPAFPNPAGPHVPLGQLLNRPVVSLNARDQSLGSTSCDPAAVLVSILA
jgi:hypothetical protein